MMMEMMMIIIIGIVMMEMMMIIIVIGIVMIEMVVTEQFMEKFPKCSKFPKCRRHLVCAAREGTAICPEDQFLHQISQTTKTSNIIFGSMRVTKMAIILIMYSMNIFQKSRNRTHLH